MAMENKMKSACRTAACAFAWMLLAPAPSWAAGSDAEVLPGVKLPSTVRDSRNMVPTLYANGCVWDSKNRVLSCMDGAGHVTYRQADDNGLLQDASASPAGDFSGNAVSPAAWTGEYPVGFIIAYAGANAPEASPDGRTLWLECDGRAIDRGRFPRLHALVGERTPDLSGRFLRGAADGEAPGTLQDDAAGEHVHLVPAETARLPAVDGSGVLSGSMTEGGASYAATFSNPANGGQSLIGQTGAASPDGTEYGETLSEGGSESRPANRAVRYFIRTDE